VSEYIQGPIGLQLEIERWQRKTPARITGYTFDAIDVLVVTLSKDGHTGRGEGVGVYYGADNATSMRQQMETLRTTIESGLSRVQIQGALPAGGARNALDCAFWDLEAKVTGVPAWQRAGLDALRPLLTTQTCHADAPEKMEKQALSHTGARAIKLKLTGEAIDADRVWAVRAALPAVWLGVDANQGFTRPFLEKLLPVLLDARVALIEQPFRIGEEALLDGLRSPIPIAADESMQTLADVPKLVGRFDVANIKLDKCGGVTEGLAIAKALRAAGLKVMVGNMGGTSLAMAPAILVGQLCDVVDLDGPLFLKSDRAHTVAYVDGYLHCPQELWGTRARTELQDQRIRVHAEFRP
jgi:L-Ala-D/L-Glu epimerase